MADRKYEFPELAFPLEHWANKIGGELRLSGIIFQSHQETRVAMLPDGLAEAFSYPVLAYNVEQPSSQEWSEILRRSDDPFVFERDETGTIKAWVRKAQYAVSGDVQQYIWARDDFECVFCGKKMGQTLLTIDHFMPLELGGENNPRNLLSCCRQQNKRKGNRHPADFCRAEGLDYQYFLDYLTEKEGKK